MLIQPAVTAGRFCSDLTPVECCLPCPSTDWLYADNFNTITTSANWINVASMVCSLFLLVSFAFLPVDKTHRHYLSVCMTMGVALMSVSIIHPSIVFILTSHSLDLSYLSLQSPNYATMKSHQTTCTPTQHAVYQELFSSLEAGVV